MPSVQCAPLGMVTPLFRARRCLRNAPRCAWLTLALAELDHVLAQLRSTTTRGATDWRSTAAHGREMDRLETKRFECAKRINEQEQRLHGVEVELRAACDAQEEIVRAEPVVVEDLDQQA